jgi:azurin
MTPRYHALCSILALAVTAMACGTPDQPAANVAAAPGAAAAPAPVVHDGRKVEITADDAMKFSVVEIRAGVGERLSVTLINNGKTPKFSMGHNWVLLAEGRDVTAFLMAASEAPTTDYVPASKRSDVLAATKLLGPAEQDTTTFTAPMTPGRYEFVCSFPGHSQVGMRGVLIVR